MLYKPSELAEELGIEPRVIYSQLIPAGMPHRRDKESGRIWLHGPEVALWVRELNARRQKMADDQAYCLKCRQHVPLVNTKRITRGRFRMLQAQCPHCGSTVNRGVKRHD